VRTEAGKAQVLATGIPRTRAYYVCTDHHHWGKAYEPKKAAAQKETA
jgi:hypothetical protein